MQTVKPARDQLFCKPDEVQKQTASGILLETKTLEKPKIAEVINVGDEVKQFSSKDKVVYKPYATSEIKLNNEDFFLIAEEDVLGKVVDV